MTVLLVLAISRPALAQGWSPEDGKSGLPGLNPKLTDRFGTPYEPRLGGAATMYPEYIATMKTMPKPERGGGAGSSERQLDGVFARAEDGRLAFHATPSLTDADVAEVLAAIE